MAATLKLATLAYGSTLIPVRPGPHLPIPEVFDFDKFWDQARLTAAIMSNASGGHIIKGVKLRIHRGYESANLTGNGMHVFWQGVKGLTIEEATKLFEESTLVALGDVRTDQYGDGYKRAIWS